MLHMLELCAVELVAIVKGNCRCREIVRLSRVEVVGSVSTCIATTNLPPKAKSSCCYRSKTCLFETKATNDNTLPACSPSWSMQEEMGYCSVKNVKTTLLLSLRRQTNRLGLSVLSRWR